MILLNIIAALALLLTISNLLFIKSLKPKQFSRSYFDEIDILIPMRNEESNVLPLLDSLRSAPGLITVLDDSSTDKTRNLLNSSNIKLSVISGQSLPEGWLGKPFACHQLVTQTNRKYIVFLDADVRLKAGAIESAIAYMEDRNWDFISPYPKQLSRGLFGFLIQPLLQWSWFASIPFFITKFLPVRSMVVANGQFFIVKRNQYIMAGGHKAVRSEVIEDLELARALISSGAKGGVVDGSRISSCLMYENNKELIDGYSKSLWRAFGGFFGTLIATFLLLATAFSDLSLSWATLLIIASRLIVAQKVESSKWSAFLHPFAIFILFILIFRSNLLKAFGKLTWKDRVVV